MMKVALLGDIALIGKYNLNMTDEAYIRLKLIHEITKSCDYVIGNLESPLTKKINTMSCKGAYIRSDPINVELLKFMRITHVNLANNHILDYGEKGKNDTIETLHNANIEYVGLNEGFKILKSKNGDKAALDGFCCLSTNPIGYGQRKGKVNLLTPEACIDFIKKSINNECLPIISAHFGIERVHYPAEEHIKLFHDLCSISAYVLHGHHPHMIQGYEIINKSLLLYSLGNLCFDKLEKTSTKTIPEIVKTDQENYIIILSIIRNKLENYEIIPLSSYNNGILLKDKMLGMCIEKISNILQNKRGMISNLRNEELQKISNKMARNLSFYISRLNYKYIISYLKCIRNRILYKIIMKKYI